MVTIEFQGYRTLIRQRMVVMRHTDDQNTYIPKINALTYAETFVLV
jgi:hypothetical protein